MPRSCQYRRLASFAVLSLLVFQALSAHARTQASRTVSAQSVESFLSRLRSAIERRDRRAVGAMIRYPITVLVSGWQVPLRDQNRFVMYYDFIITPETRCLIVQSGVARAGEPLPINPVTLSAGGFSMGGGRIWAQQTGSSFQITRLTIPPGPPTVYAPQKPRQVVFSGSGSNRPPAQFRGLLAGDASESFLVLARKGQLLQSGVSGFPGSAATVRVFDKDGAPVTARTPDGVRTWRGVIPVNGEYRIDVVRIAPYCDPPFEYLLTITLR